MKCSFSYSTTRLPAFRIEALSQEQPFMRRELKLSKFSWESGGLQHWLEAEQIRDVEAGKETEVSEKTSGKAWTGTSSYRHK
eukprot:s7104_g1.t1